MKTILSGDPRPQYQKDALRVYGMKYSGFELKFKVEDNLLEVISAEKIT